MKSPHFGGGFSAFSMLRCIVVVPCLRSHQAVNPHLAGAVRVRAPLGTDRLAVDDPDDPVARDGMAVTAAEGIPDASLTRIVCRVPGEESRGGVPPK